jgi:hypothetical protein
VRRALAWTAGIVGIAALVRWLRRQSRDAEPSVIGEAHADPAAELRRTIDESRAAQPGDEAPSAELVPESPVEDRRAAVHARGEDAIARMRGLSDDG